MPANKLHKPMFMPSVATDLHYDCAQLQHSDSQHVQVGIEAAIDLACSEQDVPLGLSDFGSLH